MDRLGEWIFMNAASIEAISTAVAALVAVIGIAIAVADAADRSRPVVLALFRRAEHNDHAIEFVVKNFGLSLARKVEVSFTPELEVREGDGTTGHLVPKRYSAPIPVLAPGQELSNIWFSPKIVNNRVVGNRTTLPDSVTVSIKYRGARWWRRAYVSIFELESTTVAWDSMSVSSTSQRGRLNLIHESLVKIAASLEKVQRQSRPLPAEDDSDLALSERPRRRWSASALSRWIFRR